MEMAKMGLLQAVCTVAVMAAVPAFAQTNTQPGDTGMGSSANNPSMHQNMQNNSGSMTPADRMGSSDESMGGRSMHRADMGHHGAMHGKTDMSQDAMVDQLNEQSYQAARSGQAFNGSGSSSGSGGMTMPNGNGSGSMNDMSGGSMSGNGSARPGGKM
jgi:hypothetical protein